MADKTGPYYVYEKGKLTHSHLKEDQRKRLKKDNPSMMDKHNTLASPSEVKGIKKLFHICLNYVARNVHLVDSLVDFPEITGKLLFDEIVKIEIVDLAVKDQNVTKTLSLFSHAYGELFMSSLNLQNNPLLINHFTNLLTAFRELTRLDLSHCHLGNGHEILSQIIELKRLKVLKLSDNSLGDSAVRKFTTPTRVFGRGPLQLEVLDISENRDITKESLKYISCFKSLSLLNITGCRIQFGSLSTFCSKSGLILAPKGAKIDTELTAVETVGWGKELVKSWIVQIKDNLQKQAELAFMKGKVVGGGSFYRRKSDAPGHGGTKIEMLPMKIAILAKPGIIYKESSSIICNVNKTLSSEKSGTMPKRNVSLSTEENENNQGCGLPLKKENVRPHNQMTEMQDLLSFYSSTYSK